MISTDLIVAVIGSGAAGFCIGWFGGVVVGVLAGSADMIDKLKLVNWLRHQHNIIDNCKQTTMAGNRMELA